MGIDIWELVEEHKERVLLFKKDINANNYSEILSQLYKYIKSITQDYYLDGSMHDAYSYLLDFVNEVENYLYYYEKIIDTEIDFSFCDKDNYLSVLVKHARDSLLKDSIHFYNGEAILTNKCKVAAKSISSFLRKDGIENYILEIYPGYDFQSLLYNKSGYHFANIVKYKGEHYLVDVTYPQFFYVGGNNLDRLGVVNSSGCGLGRIALMDEKRKNLASNLLHDGYVKLKEDDLKIYLDSFTISFRNGLFYENNNDFTYTTDYFIDDYIRFLRGIDNQVKHEGRENLGYQKRPLKNCHLDFRKK